MTTANEQEVAPEPVVTDLDAISDWVARLENARKAKQIAEGVEREAKEVIERWMAERGAQYGLVDGVPVIRRQIKSRRYPPRVSILQKVAPEILEQYGTTSEWVEISFVRGD